VTVTVKDGTVTVTFTVTSAEECLIHPRHCLSQRASQDVNSCCSTYYFAPLALPDIMPIIALNPEWSPPPALKPFVSHWVHTCMLRGSSWGRKEKDAHECQTIG